MSMYSGVIKSQAETIQRQLNLLESYNSLTQELIDVLAQHIDVSDYERRLKALGKGGGE